ncbi:AI-2E family transporter [Streptococcus macacae]|uniref:Membrane protein n=1 Tax=Streptococcus macacae NCTC 11558 TaxID=764298 RepID=G5JVN2_9STRE|nr:AI-2E family transporter [Streptococcus macacae]EHJ52772.1 putative membrane protein [Streptococcus macacae NCTC 11558]SUN78700.1 membrane protein [Streptococcus macacae NCTC 11558]
MENKKQEKFNVSWFFRWFLNNQAVTVLLVMLLVFLNILAFTKISPIFKPVFSFLGAIMLPLVISALIYYLLKPIVDFIERRGISRITAITIVFLVIAGLLIWGGARFFPMLEEQLLSFFKHLPSYVKSVDKQISHLLKDNRLASYRPQIEDAVTNISKKATSYAEAISRGAVAWASNFASVIARTMVAILISPFIVFYLLRDSQKMKKTFVSYLPVKIRQPAHRILGDVNRQLSGYVQGQVTVAIIVGVMFSIMFTLIGLRYAVTFGIIAGVLNMVPYLGSFLATIPVFILALVEGPLMVVKVALVFIAEQTIEGRFVTPLIIGSKLSIHPITILFILLTAGSMFGVWGVFLGIPVYASIKVVVKEIFEWYKPISGLYEEKEEIKEDVKQ